MICADCHRFNFDRYVLIGTEVQDFLLLRRKLEISKMIRAKANHRNLAGFPVCCRGFPWPFHHLAQMTNWIMRERPFEDSYDVIRPDEANEHTEAKGDEAFD